MQLREVERIRSTLCLCVTATVQDLFVLYDFLCSLNTRIFSYLILFQKVSESSCLKQNGMEKNTTTNTTTTSNQLETLFLKPQTTPVQFATLMSLRSRSIRSTGELKNISQNAIH